MYNFIGAALFSHYEHWSFLDGFYFTFITISTIGFGDLVPKILSDKDPDYGGVPAWWVETSYVVYVMVGLTVIQMSFELTKETINNQFYSLGRSAGLIESQQEDGAAEPGMERQLSEPGEGELRRRHRRATRRHHSGGSRGMSLRTPWGDRSLDNGGSSPSMRSAEPGSGQPSTEVSSAESVPRPVRPKSARPRRSEQYRDEY
ncbi:potassium channel subfamily K member 9-like [Pollicipes pollicipes]|uniref:potassium channel subfamily K member 9-like n=1 Tax=Pollicipes pollicipes TaxID=41117 RepID=UPI001884B25D|nr:potassium channel subfamily K member 9-like [Pollicipes pollicipes]